MYSLPVIGGHWHLRPSGRDLIDNGYMVPYRRDEGVDIFDGDSVTVDFLTYLADATITGTATFTDGGPVAGAEIWADTFDFFTRTETGADGTYALNVSSALDTVMHTDEFGNTYTSYGYWVNAWVEGALPQPPGYGDVPAGATGKDFLFFPTDATLSGHIFFETTFNPVRNAFINAYTMDDTNFFFSGTDTDDDGFYELELIGGSTWFIEVFRPDMGWPPAITDTIEVFAGVSIVRDYFLPELAQFVFVEGHVYNPDGFPVGNARVEIIQTDGPFYAQTFTDGDGYFFVDGVPTFSQFDIVASAEGYPPQVQHHSTGADGIYVGFFLGGERIRVAGQVTSAADGAPIIGALVLAFEQGFLDEGEFTDEGGFYELFLKPAEYLLRAGATGFLVDSVRFVVETDTTVDFVLADAGALLTETVTGTVTAPDDTPIPRVFVLFVTADYMAQTFTGADGIYTLDLLPGSYFSLFAREGFLEETKEWDVPGGPFDVVMTPETFLDLTAVLDAPNDHGRWVHARWSVNRLIAGEVSRFELWEIGFGANPMGDMPIMHAGTSPALGDADRYFLPARTSQGDVIPHWYVVTGHYGDDPWPRFISNQMSGASMDNLPPQAPANLATAVESGTVTISWAPSVDDPEEGTAVQFYSVYRSDSDAEFALVGNTAETSFADALGSGVYQWQVTATDFAGNVSAPSAPTTAITLGVDGNLAVPEVYALRSNYPNPFNPSTTIVYELPEAGPVSLKVYDLTGKHIRTLVNESVPAGYFQVVWDGRDAHGAALATGVYFYRLVASQGYAKTLKMVLMK